MKTHKQNNRMDRYINPREDGGEFLKRNWDALINKDETEQYPEQAKLKLPQKTHWV